MISNKKTVAIGVLLCLFFGVMLVTFVLGVAEYRQDVKDMQKDIEEIREDIRTGLDSLYAYQREGYEAIKIIKENNVTKK